MIYDFYNQGLMTISLPLTQLLLDSVIYLSKLTLGLRYKVFICA